MRCNFSRVSVKRYRAFAWWRHLTCFDASYYIQNCFFLKNRSCVIQSCITKIATKCILVVVVKMTSSWKSPFSRALPSWSEVNGDARKLELVWNVRNLFDSCLISNVTSPPAMSLYHLSQFQQQNPRAWDEKYLRADNFFIPRSLKCWYLAWLVKSALRGKDKTSDQRSPLERSSGVKKVNLVLSNENKQQTKGDKINKRWEE